MSSSRTRNSASSRPAGGSPARAGATRTVRRPRRSALRRTGERAFGLVLLARVVLTGLLALLLLAAGVWSSWGTARYAMLPRGHERGTVTVTSCRDDRCTGTFAPEAPASPHSGHRKVTLTSIAAPDAGQRATVVIRPGSSEAVRTGLSGVLYSWVPLGGALLLAALVVAGGMRLRRTAWGMGILGGLVMCAAFLSL
ncbi:hypothetical protein ACFV3R_24090 [Streptomyces sp. NPDC059740]|uniref:hypothetical protein n=1 Tax=Streptomyces sp. NPDC059740 TaxID=3346926 RepID=UPI003664B3AF